MVGNFRPADVADAFIKQYYYILNKYPENVHKFYQELSVQGWPGPDGVVTPVTTLRGIEDKVMSSDYKYCSAEVKTADAQESLEGGIIVAVTGCLVRKDNMKKNFTQTFFLAKQERGFYVLNDILQFFDVCETTTNTAPSSDDENDQPATTQNSVPCSTSDSPTSLDTKAAVENGKVEEAIEAIDLSVSEDTLANGAACTPSLASCERVVEPATNAKGQSVVALATDADVPSVEPAKNAKVPSAVAPVTNAKVPSVVTPASNVTQKITYASMLAKETLLTSPRAAAVVTSNNHKQTLASPTTKASAPLADGSPKVSTSSSSLSKVLTSSSKVVPKSPTSGQGAPNTSAYAEARGIYIGGLPYSITKHGVVEVVKKFGPVRRYSDTVQIRRHEDGFCCGFVEFESADSARRAVEAHHVMFGEKEAYITYKRSSYGRGNNGRARSPSRGGNRNGDFRGPRRSSPSDERSRQGSRDRLK